jgi:hypothetical protein
VPSYSRDGEECTFVIFINTFNKIPEYHISLFYHSFYEVTTLKTTEDKKMVLPVLKYRATKAHRILEA